LPVLEYVDVPKEGLLAIGANMLTQIDVV
jgi:hypothetical protein